MAALPGVTRAAVVDEPGTGTGPQRHPARRLVFAILMASALTAPTSVWSRPAAETTDDLPQEPGAAAAPPTASLERIRRALAVERQTELPGLDRVDFRDDVPFVDQRPATRLLRGLDFIGGVDLVGAGGPVPIGSPTHRDMLSLATPRAVSEAVSADALGVATASAFALVPYAVKTIAGWLRGAGGDAAPDHPILTESEETRALAGVRADRHVLDAGVRQRGRTVALSLVVPADTPPATARAIAERFVLLVKTFASAEPDPDGEVGAGDFDYVVRVSSPTEAVIALGGKATSDTTINW